MNLIQEAYSGDEIQSSNVLIVDDAKLSHHVIEQILKSAGYYNIYQLSDAKEVKNFLSYQHIDVIVMDWMMPVIDGLSLTRLVRGLDQKHGRHTSIIMVTGKDSAQAMSDAFDNGVDDFIAKSDVNIQLIPRLELMIRKKLKEIALKQNHEKLKKLIVHQRSLITRDPVSKLPVYAEAKEYFLNLLKENAARNRKASGIMLNLNNYEDLKAESDIQTMQQLIEDFAVKIKRLLRPQDFLARVHPHIFMIFISHKEHEPVKSLQRIDKTLNDFAIYTKEGFKTMNVSVVAASIDPNGLVQHRGFENCIEFLQKKSKSHLSSAEKLRLHWPEAQDLKIDSIESLVFNKETF